MDTLLHVGQIVAGGTVLAAALVVSASRRARPGSSGTSVTTYTDLQVAGANGLFGGLIGLAAIVFGVAGLAGASVMPAPVGFFFSAVGMISILLAIDTTPASYPVAVDGLSVIPVQRPNSAMAAIPAQTWSQHALLPADRDVA
jgi:hypothetical protein